MNFFDEYNGIRLDFIDFTANFKNAMRDWENKVIPWVRFDKEKAQKAEEIIKKKLRIENFKP